MLSKKIQAALEGSSAIRAMFVEGKELAAKVGAENVFDFSLGNPATPAPESVKQAIKDLLDETDPLVLHGYMSNSGYEDVRAAVAENLNSRFGTEFTGENIVMTVGAAGGINIVFKAVLDNTIVGYSFSKSLSLPGERIGYLVVPNEASDAKDLLAGIEVANRTLGFVNAPSLMQKAVAACLGEKTDLDFYDKNRRDLYKGLTKLGFTCMKPQGAFYLWLKSPVENEADFVAAAKKYNLILVKGSAFGCGGYVRLAYCIPNEKINRSLTAFASLAKEYGLGE